MNPIASGKKSGQDILGSRKEGNKSAMILYWNLESASLGEDEDEELRGALVLGPYGPVDGGESHLMGFRRWLVGSCLRQLLLYATSFWA